MSTQAAAKHIDANSKLRELLGKRNPMAYPRLLKVVLNMGVGEAVNDKKVLENAVSDLEAIAGQKVVVTKCRRSEAGFKIREGWPIGCKVTLRKNNMRNFIDALVNVVLPKVKDFKGISKKSFDGRGNFNIGIKEQIVFSQIQYDKIDKLRGFNITLVTSATNNDDAVALLKSLGFPFIEEKEKS